jgi:hypothetical protein
MGRGRRLLRKIEPIDANRPRDVLENLLSCVDKVGCHLASNLPPSVLRNRDAARFSNSLDQCCDVDAISQDVLTLNDDVADVDAYPELDRICLGPTGIVFSKLSLNLDGAGDSIHGAGELHQRPVTHNLDDPSCMGSNHRINEPAPQGIQTGKGPGLV